MNAAAETPDPLLFGSRPSPGLVAIERVEGGAGGDEVALFFRDGAGFREEREPLQAFLVAEEAALAGCPGMAETTPLQGRGRLNRLARFGGWAGVQQARQWLAKATGASPSDPAAPFLFLNDPVHQHLVLGGRTLFHGLEFEDLRRLQVDIECRTSEGYEFCNAEREGDRILAIGLADSTGWSQTLSGAELDEAAMLREFVRLVRERDPDVIEGHNVFNFDLPYLAARARRYRVRLAIGRDGSAPVCRPSRFGVGERTIAYDRFDVYGRHVVDTYFLAQAYDVSHRSLEGFGLKEVAVHFGVAAPNRTYLDGSRIGEVFERDPALVLRYLADDVAETRSLAGILSRSHFVQAQMLPYSYQNVCVRGTATKIDALMLREYLRRGVALPQPGAAHAFEGGYTDMFLEGVVRTVHHADVRSLYPSLMLTRRLAPATDELGVFLRLLDTLRAVRLDARRRMKAAGGEAERLRLDALQTTFKVLINSFYGYLGFSQARFGDFAAAEEVTAQGRALLRGMIDWLRAHDATPVEIDTDGVYFVPPEDVRAELERGAAAKLEPAAEPGGRHGGRPSRDGETARPAPSGGPGSVPAVPARGSPAESKLESFRRAFAGSLPEGLEIEFDGEYEAMYSHRMKNYALLAADGTMTVKGAALKSRGLEPFQREFMQAAIRLKLEGRDGELTALRASFETAIRERQWPVARLAKTETLQDSPSTYAAKVGGDRRARSAVYELALKSGREYRAGDQLSYYVSGEKKNVSVHEAARLVSEWNPQRRDENVAYYLAKLDALCEKFGGEAAPAAQGELDFSAPAPAGRGKTRGGGT